MDCWQTLGIDSSADKKAIKIAYAKLLKTTRPDDNPEGFIALNQAYKTALAAVAPGRQSVSNHIKQKPSEPHFDRVCEPTISVTPTTQSSTASLPVMTSTVSAPINTRDTDQLSAAGKSDSSIDIGMSDSEQSDVSYLQPDYRRALDEDRQRIKTRAYQLIESAARVNSIEEWQYIETVGSMVDLDFSREIGDLLFAIVSEANVSGLKNNEFYIQPPVLKYLNDYFQWNKSWKHYEKLHGYKQSHAILGFIGTATQGTENPELYLARRMVAFSIDLMFVVAIVVLSQVLPGAQLLSSAGLIYLFFGVPSLEASPWQASVGKWMLGLKVVNNRGKRLSWFRSFCRNFTTILSLGLIQFSLIVNLFLYFRKRTLLQDSLTASHVVRVAGE